MKARLALIGVGSAVLLTLAWYFALWKPASSNLDEAQQREVAASQEVSSLTTELARLKRLEANKEALDAARAALATKIPDEDQLDTFILELNQISNTAGITLQSLSPGEPAVTPPAAGAAAAGGPTPVTLQMQVQGDYFAILRFMDAVRDGTRLVIVDNLSLSEGGEGGQMSASIGGRMFIAAPVVAAPAATATTPTASAS